MKKVCIFILCLAAAMLNIAVSKLNYNIEIPLYMDTVFTVSVTLTCGLFWGMLTGFLTNMIGHTFLFWGWEGYLFALCNIATAAITYFFTRFFPSELGLTIQQKNRRYVFLSASTPRAFPNSRRLGLFINRVVVLILLSFSLCLAMSILGGIISTFIHYIRHSPEAEQIYNPASVMPGFLLFGQGMPIILKEILSRIPMNIIDRLIAAFGGYGIAIAGFSIYNAIIKRINELRELNE